MDFGEIKKYYVEGNTVRIEFEKNIGMVTVITDSIINIFANFDGIKRSSKAVEGEKNKRIHFYCENIDGKIVIETKEIKAIICDNFYVDFYNKEGELVCSDYKGKRVNTSKLSEKAIKLLEAEGHTVNIGNTDSFNVQVVKETGDLEAVYGLGDKTGFMNKLGYEYEMWNTDDPSVQVECYKALYKSIPFFIGVNKTNLYGIFFDTTYHGYFNMGKESSKYYYFAAKEGDLNYYYFAGDTINSIIQAYTYLTGTAPLPQLFTLGYQQSRWGYESEEEVRNVAELMREYKIPCDTIHLDIDYMDNYKVFSWNKSTYTDGGKMISDLGKEGFKFVTIIDPGVKVEKGYNIYEEGIEKGYFAKDSSGNVYENVVWPGDSVYPDFGNESVRKWWGDNQKYLVDMGVRGVWNDMNEPASFNGPLPDDVCFRDGDRVTNHLEIHNVYGHLMAKATYEGLKKYDKRRPFIITRACFSGTQKYSTAWTGDNHSIWAHLQMALPQLCNLGLSGMPNVGTDVGGFSADATGELMARWVQVGCFSPLFRNHSASGTRYQEPWQFEDNIIDIYREYVELRYSLIPYFYDLFHIEENTGLPILRPLVMKYTWDKETRNLNDEFMVGENILVAPVVYQGQTKRMVYLPKGNWFDYHTGEKICGDRYIIKAAPLNICPIYILEGSIIPNYPKQQYIGEKEINKLILNIYEGEGTYEHYQDDGETFNYQKGEYNLYRFETKGGKLYGCLTYKGYGMLYKGVIINYKGKTIEADFNEDKFEIEL